MPKIPCFLVVPHNVARVQLRRFNFKTDQPCLAGRNYHDVDVDIGEEPWTKPHRGEGLIPSEEMKADPRWPVTCDCGYVFKPTDEWQHNFRQLYIDKTTGKTYLLADGPPGMMWDADWMAERGRKDRPGPDGMMLCVRLPHGHDWLIDGPSSNGAAWTRTGTAPNVTARPSILVSETKRADGTIVSPGYHGWLTDGVLEDC